MAHGLIDLQVFTGSMWLSLCESERLQLHLLAGLTPAANYSRLPYNTRSHDQLGKRCFLK